MKNARRWLLVSFVLGLLSFGSFIAGRLAMTDIFHGEPDLSLEWRVVSDSFLPVLIFHLVSMVASIVAYRRLGQVEREG